MIFTDKTAIWFDDFIGRYQVDGVLPTLLEQKREHSHRVVENCALLVSNMGWDEAGDDTLAHALGLLHDIGRFAQYNEFETFHDGESIDHGDLAAEILEEGFEWDGISDRTRDALLTGVRFHNKLELPATLSIYQYKWAALIRDADKMDIFRSIQRRIDDGTIYNMLPRHKLAQGLSRALVREIEKSGKGSYAKANSLEDYRLIQLTWMNDLNYPETVRTLREEGIFERICADLSGHRIDELLSRLMQKMAVL